MKTVAVVGGGVAGCAAAVAAAEAGARAILIEAARHVGGAAARGEHRTLCGLAPIDAAAPDLLEPDLTASWVNEVATGAPYRQGRVWLWPTDSRALQAGLSRRLERCGVERRLAAEVTRVAKRGDSIRVGAEDVAVDGLIDASGNGCVARLLGLGLATPSQWSAYRAVVRAEIAAGPAARARALAAAQSASGSEAALALTPLDGGLWQLSLDVRRGTPPPAAAAVVERIADALGAELLQCAIGVADRDDGRPRGDLALEELFAERDRGLCWAAWPREEHRADGVAWTWPPRDRYGIPERATRAPGAAATCRFIGKGMPVSLEAAAALRVTGTCFALGAAVGRTVARGG